jgi:hypothetical protein
METDREKLTLPHLIFTITTFCEELSAAGNLQLTTPFITFAFFITYKSFPVSE